MQEQSTAELTQGAPIKVILKFFLPISLSNLVRNFYFITDTFIIGHFFGVNAFAALGAVNSLSTAMATYSGQNTGAALWNRLQQGTVK